MSNAKNNAYKKEHVVKKLAELADISENEAKSRVDQVLQSIALVLEDIATVKPDEKNVVGKLQLVGFGGFTVKRKPGRSYPNPQTGEPVEKPDTNVATFKPGKYLKDIVQ